MSTTEDQIVDLAVSHDRLVSGAARDLVADVIVEIDHQLKYGTPDRKASIIRAFASPLLRAASQQTESDELAELRAEVRNLQQMILGGHDDEAEEEQAVDLEDMKEYDTAMDEPPIPE